MIALEAETSLRKRVAPTELIIVIVIGVFALLVPLALLVLLYRWGGWVARRQGDGPLWRAAKRLPLWALVFGVLSVAAPLTVLLGQFRRVATAPDAQTKQALLSMGVSEALNTAAIPGLATQVLVLLSVVLFTVGSLREPRPSAPAERA